MTIAVVAHVSGKGWSVCLSPPTEQVDREIVRVRDAEIVARKELAARGGGRLICVALSGLVTCDTMVPGAA